MAIGGHVLMLIDHLLGRQTIVDIKETETEQDFDNRPVRTSNVHFILKQSETTDIVLDEFTVSAFEPAWEKVKVSAGRVQWFEWIFDIEAQDSPSLEHFDTKDCDPSITHSSRWALLCVFKDALDEPYLDWVYGEPGGPYPHIPHHGVPLALVKYAPGGLIAVSEADIIMLRTVKATYVPTGYYLYPPVVEEDKLYDYKDVPEGATAFVISQAQWYFYSNGLWSSQSKVPFDNTVYSKDIMEETARVDIPWILKSAAELDVHRDGFKMDPTNDYEVFLGPAPYILFKYLLYPHQRILLTRNPFAANAYSSDADNALWGQVSLYVDGEIGHDAFPGTQEKPFKTLQAAFESIPMTAKQVYTVHARRLKYSDVIVSDEYGNKCWGILKNRTLTRFQIFIEDNCEWDDSMDYAFVCVDTSFIFFGQEMPPYKFRLNLCTSYFYKSYFLSWVTLAGGSSVLRNTTAKAGDSRLQISGACVAALDECEIFHLLGTAAGYATLINCKITAVEENSAASLHFQYCTFLSTVTVSNAYFQINNSTIDRNCSGNFYGAHILGTNLDQIGDVNAPAQTFFLLTNSSTMTLTTCEFTSIQPNAIKLVGNSSAALRGVTIKNTKGDGIYLNGSCHLKIQNSEVSNSFGSGILLERASSGYGEYLYGSGNSKYGVLALKYSTMERGPDFSISGVTGTYLEVIEGGNTVAATYQDLYVGPLDVKIITGPGIAKDVVPTGVPDDYLFKLSVNPAQLLDPGSEIGSAFNFAPKTSVQTYPVAMNPGDIFDMDTPFMGDGYISSVNQRSTIITPTTKVVPTTEATEGAFLQQDKTLGTLFTSTGVTLVNRPGIGYSKNYPYYFTSLWTSFSAIQAYVISSLIKLTVDATMPTGTEVRVGISPNAGSSWYEYVAGDWAQLPGSSTAAKLANAPLYTTVNAYPPIAWETFRVMTRSYIDVGFAMITSSELVTPEIHSYTWDFTTAGFQKDITHKFERTYYPGRATFENITSEVLDPPLVFTVFPLANRDF